MEIIFFDREGTAICYCDDAEEIYFFDGTPAGLLDSGYLFTFGGKNIGWLEDGVVRNLDGSIVLFTQDAIQDFALPAMRSIPGKSGKRIPPQHVATTVRSTCSVKRYSWWNGDVRQFFGIG